MQQDVPDKVQDLRRYPWHVLLLVKWVLQDAMASDRTGRPISDARYHDLRQRLHDFPERINFVAEGLPQKLFFRHIIQSQVRFQKDVSPGFVREAAILAALSTGHPLRRLFMQKTSLDVLDFVDLSFAMYGAIVSVQRTLNVGWLHLLREKYCDARVEAFISLVSRSYGELRQFCRQLPDATRHRTSELYEFPLIGRYPLLRTDSRLECEHRVRFVARPSAGPARAPAPARRAVPHNMRLVGTLRR